MGAGTIIIAGGGLRNALDALIAASANQTTAQYNHSVKLIQLATDSLSSQTAAPQPV
jgi:hypothetical protein